MKNFLVFESEADAVQAESAITQAGVALFQQYGAIVENGRVVDGPGGRVLVERFDVPFELSDGRWAIADPHTEGWLDSQSRNGLRSPAEAATLNAQIADQAMQGITGSFVVLSQDEVGLLR